MYKRSNPFGWTPLISIVMKMLVMLKNILHFEHNRIFIIKNHLHTFHDYFQTVVVQIQNYKKQ